MIRLSQLTALHVLDQDIARDLDVSPKLYAYRSTKNNRSETLLVQEDTSPLQQMTRKHAYSPFWNNTLLGTANFYPEQALGLTNFHNDSTIQQLLSDQTQPTIEYKKAILYFSQGFITDPNIKGHSVRLYCKLNNGTEVTLASVVDFRNDSNITAQSSKFFESQVWNEGLELEFIDVEYLLNTNVAEVQAVKQLLFGNERPTEVLVEYSAFSEDSVDEFIEEDLLFTRLSFRVINEQSFPTTFEQSDMYVDLKLSQGGYAIHSEPKHTRFDFEPYINTLKESEEVYNVEHYFTTTTYDINDQVIATEVQMVKNPTLKFDEILYRPIVSNSTDHFKINSQIKIENIQTGLVYRMESTLIITNEYVQAFKAAPVFSFNLTEDKIQNRVTKQINKIVQSPEVPQIITIEKKLYVQAQPLKELILLDADQTVKLQVDNDITGNSRLYLKIDNLIFDSEPNHMLTFRLPKHTYLTEATKYTLMDDTYSAISTGKLIKD